MTDRNELLTTAATTHCRAIVNYFQDTDDTTGELEELAAAIRSTDHNSGNHIAIQLHHHILPQLEEIGALEYDPRSNMVRYWGHDELERLVNTVADP